MTEHSEWEDIALVLAEVLAWAAEYVPPERRGAACYNAATMIENGRCGWIPQPDRTAVVNRLRDLARTAA